jgi:hypothetical protein
MFSYSYPSFVRSWVHRRGSGHSLMRPVSVLRALRCVPGSADLLGKGTSMSGLRDLTIPQVAHRGHTRRVLQRRDFGLPCLLPCGARASLQASRMAVTCAGRHQQDALAP